MRKLKKLLPALMAIVMALALVFSVACSGSCKPASNNEPVKTLQSITLDAAQAKTEYEVGDEYSSEGLKVTANFKTGNEESTENVALTDENLSIDSSGYVKATEGTYTIKVSYTNGGVTKTAEYDVTVVKHVAGPGLKVTLAEGAPSNIVLSPEMPTATIDLTKIKVEVVDGKGATLATLTSAEYTVELYKGTEKLTSASGLQGGVYQIWAKTNKGYVLDYDWRPDDFVIVNVIDTPVSMKFIEEGAVLTQKLGTEDEMSDTWKFEVTYSSGDKATKTLKDEGMTITGFSTCKVTSAGEAVVGYSETALGDKKEVTPVTVNYSVTYTSPDHVQFALNLTELQRAMGLPDGGAETAFTQEHLTGANSFLTALTEDNPNHKLRLANSCITIKKAALSFDIPEGAQNVKVSLKAASTGGSNDSNISLKHGNSYVKASNHDGLTEYTTGNVYTVHGTTMVDINYTLTESGTYVIDTVTTLKDTRIGAITVEFGSVAAVSYELNPNDLIPLIDDGAGGKYSIPQDLGAIKVGDAATDLALNGTFQWNENATFTSTGSSKLNTDSKAASVSVKGADGQSKTVSVYRLELAGKNKPDDKIILNIGAEATLYVYARLSSAKTDGRYLGLYSGSELLSPAANASDDNFGTKFTTTDVVCRQLEITSDMLAKGSTFDLKANVDTICIMWVTVIYK